MGKRERERRAVVIKELAGRPEVDYRSTLYPLQEHEERRKNQIHEKTWLLLNRRGLLLQTDFELELVDMPEHSCLNFRLSLTASDQQVCQ